MKTALDQFITGSKELPLGERVFNYATFIGIFLAFVQAIQIVVLDFPLNNLIPPSLITLASFCGFYASRFKGLFKYTVWPLMFTVVGAMSIQ
ncbi:MAG: hypothetical protein GY810_13765 [Aureispira sp.]|nr:hypothetical protein [Aureispira sp.]